jgi:hypothetical protein
VLSLVTNSVSVKVGGLKAVMGVYFKDPFFPSVVTILPDPNQ